MKKINKEVDYELIVSHYLKSYELYHNEKQLISIMNKMINKEDIPELSSDLKTIDKNILSATVSKIVLKFIKAEKKGHDFVSLLPSILSNNMKKVSNEEKKSNINYSLKRKIISGSIIALTTVSALAFSSKNHKLSVEKNSNEIKKESFYDRENDDVKAIMPSSVGVNSQVYYNSELYKDLKNSSIDKNQSEVEQVKTKKVIKKDEKKDKILNKYKKCTTLEDILKREKELKSLNMTNKDKIYKKCPLSPELQRFMYEQSIIYGYPVDFTFSIIYTETRGEFNSSGTVSYNYGNNYDMGLTQQNSESSAKMFAEKFNMNYDDACFYIRYNDYVNIVSAFIEYEEIASRRSFDPEEFAGCYNGWLNWRGKDVSREYVDIFNKAYYDKYKKYHKVIKR